MKVINNKPTKFALNEDLFDLDPSDDMDMDEYELDSIDDSSEIDDANQITVLKKKAADYAKKYQEIFKEMVQLGKKLDLTISHNDELEIEIKKANGIDAKLEKDLDDIDKELNAEESEEFDDSFGPSEFDSRASQLGPDEEIKDESLQNTTENVVNEEYPWNKNSGTLDLSNFKDPNELYIDPNDIDDDF